MDSVRIGSKLIARKRRMLFQVALQEEMRATSSCALRPASIAHFTFLLNQTRSDPRGIGSSRCLMARHWSNLSSIILQILNWDEDHLYEFRIKGKTYTHFGDDIFIVESKDACFSCAAMLRDLELVAGDDFVYIFDFGDWHTFRLSIQDVRRLASSFKRVSILACEGSEIPQYPHQEDVNTEETQRAAHSPVSIARSGSHNLIRFIREEDKSILEQWRESNDRRLWQKAVTILDNRIRSVREIAEKIEQPVPKVQTWISSFNRKGINGLNPPRKKRDEARRRSIVEQKKKRLGIEGGLTAPPLPHHRAYGSVHGGSAG